jgi:competence protein ComEA
MPTLPPSKPRPTLPIWVLRRMDQAGVALLVVVGLTGTIAWWIAQGGLSGRLVELERASPQTARFTVDVNAAEWPELAALPGVGPTLAKRIVDHRQQFGRFRDLSDLRQVRGMGPITLQRIEPYLRPLPSRSTVAGP